MSAEAGIRIQYAEGMGEITEAAVKRLLKKIRRGACGHLYLALDPDGESSFLQMDSGNGRIFLVIGEERPEGNRVRWIRYMSHDPRYDGSEEEAPVRAGQDRILMRETIRDAGLAAACVEHYIRTGEPWPGMEWMKLDDG